MNSAYDPDGKRLPIKVDATCNGEFAPRPLPEAARRGNALARERAGEATRRLGLTRRGFLTSAAGAASTLLAFNDAHGASGGFFDLPREAALDRQLAENVLGSSDFIFDIQSHFVNPSAVYRNSLGRRTMPLSNFPKARCELGQAGDKWAYLQCFNAEEYVKDIYLDSDTDVVVLSFVPSLKDERPLSMQDAEAAVALVDSLKGTGRLLIHGPVNPRTPTGLSEMEELKERFAVSAWKSYTQFGSDGRGYRLDDEEYGQPFIEKARALGVPLICVHKGLPFPNFPHAESTCADVGPAAKRNPDIGFIIYHSGHEFGKGEGPYDPAGPHQGVDILIKSLEDAGIGPGGNVYAELGSTWRMLMRDPTAAAHVMGKLLKHLGPDNVLWGTDSIWYGSPQDQIEAFRTFQISDEFQERYGYPAITPEMRAKIFGLSSARLYGVDVAEMRRKASNDWIGRSKADYAAVRDPSFSTHGPRTAGEFAAFQAIYGEGP